MANARWDKDRARRERLAAMETDRQKNLVVILRDNRTGEEKILPWGPDVWWRLRMHAEVDCEW